MTKSLRRLTITDFAASLGLSPATVSRAFTDNGRISAKTKQRILKQAIELGYRPNIHARNLTSQQSDSVALFYPELRGEEPDYFLAEIMLGINRNLHILKKTLQIHPFDRNATDSEMQDYINLLLADSYAGIIVLGETVGSKTLVSVAQQSSIPCIGIGPAPAPDYNCLYFDNAAGALLAGKYFRDTGRQHPAYLAGFPDASKESGFQQGFRSDIVIHEGGHSFRHGYLAYDRLLRDYPATDSVLCANDVLAIGFLKRALENGVKVPEQLAIIGFDNIHPTRYVSPALSTVSLNLYSIGVKAVQMLGEVLNGSQQIESEIIECALILRQSS